MGNEEQDWYQQLLVRTQPGNLVADRVRNGSLEVAYGNEQIANGNVLRVDNLSVGYRTGKKITQILEGVSLCIPRGTVYGIMGPSAAGKSTLLWCLNRMNDADIKRDQAPVIGGRVWYENVDVYDPRVDPVLLRQRMGMIFQKPNPFPKSIRANVEFGPQVVWDKQTIRERGGLEQIVHDSLVRAQLWDEVESRLNENALTLSGGQQQRLCIARALAVEPAVLLMDEPCSALDPGATQRIEDLMASLKGDTTVVLVSHSISQIARTCEQVAYLDRESLDKPSYIIESGDAVRMMLNPQHRWTQAFVMGRAR